LKGRPDVYTLAATGPQQLYVGHPANGHREEQHYHKGEIPMAGIPEDVAHPDFNAMGVDNPPTIQHELDRVDMNSSEITDR